MKLYEMMPVWAQSIAVNAMSARRRASKYGGSFRDELVRLAANESKPRDQLLAEQQAALRSMLEYACEHVPYYREMDCPADDLSLWPIMDKDVVAAAPAQFLSDRFVPDKLVTRWTGGTMGAPLPVRSCAEDFRTEQAFRWRHRAWGEVPYPARGAYITGHCVVPLRQKRPPYWRVDRFQRRLLCSSHHLLPANLPLYMEALTRFRPDFVEGHPSSLYLLGQHMTNHGVQHIRPKAMFSTGEPLFEFQREMIEKAFGTRVLDRYGQAEMAGAIVQCPAGALHVRTDYGYLELLEDGTMIWTGLINRAMPLVRYRVGDVAVGRDDACSCGCEFPLIDRIAGRLDDVIQTADGQLIGGLDRLVGDASKVREMQMVQHDPGELVIRVVRDRGFGNDQEAELRREITRYLGDGLRVQFEYPDALERTTNGKLRFVVSELEPVRLSK